LGFTLAEDSEYGMVFSNGVYSIDVEADRNYHPSLSMSLQLFTSPNSYQAEYARQEQEFLGKLLKK
jgi:hypothetical protein